MDVEDENISTLMSMGFPDIGEIKRALRLAKNDLNEAVAILTNDQSVTSYGPVADLNIDVDMKDSAASSKASATSEDGVPVEADNEEGFPETHLYELESRVFTDQWSIPYKKDESLHKCLVAATKLIEEGDFENDDNCQRFLNRCMPEAFRKLLNSGAVRRWNPEIQKGIYNMLELFFDLLVVRLRHKPVPVAILNQIFAAACDLECEWNSKNKLQLSEDKHWEDLFGQGETFARCPENFSQDPYGWLVDLLNHFGAKNGFGLIQDVFEREDLDPVAMAAILKPLGNCAELLSPTAVCPMLTKCMDKAVHYVTSLEDKDLKHKDIGAVLDLLVALKLLCKCLWPNQADEMNNLRLQVILRMLKTPHFSTRMNALKEVSRLVEEAESASPKKSSIPTDKLAEWLSDHQVLSVALEGNIDHVQYTDRIKGLVEFLGPRLSSDELSQIWAMGDKSFHVVDNLHGVLAAAAPKLAGAQFDHLLHLVQANWNQQRNGSDRVRDKLLTFLGQLGKECRVSKTGAKILEVLWELARHPALPCHLVERALHEHLNVLSDIPNKEHLRKTYVLRCIDDLKKGNQGTLPLLRHLLNVAKSIVKGTGSYHKPDKAALVEWNHNHEIVKLLLVSLGRCHGQAVASSRALGQALGHDTVVDGRYGYRHGQLVQGHLDLLQFLLKEADLYLPWNRCKELWDTLVTNCDACEADRECCFQWFASCLGDMQPETQSSLFRDKMLKCDPAHLTLKGFECIKTFFESVNVSDGKMRRFGAQTIVEKLDPTGTDFFWQVALESPSEELAAEAMEHILNISYLLLAPRLKKDPTSLHKKFINDCYKRLESLVPGSKSGGGGGSHTPSVAVDQLNALAGPHKAACFRNIRRLLELTEKYISTVEEAHPVPRTILPHGMSFRGESLCLHVKAEESKTEFDLQVHSHETVWAVKQKIASILRASADQLMLVIGDRPSAPGREQRPLCQVGVVNKQTWLVKSSSSAATVSGAGVQLSELKENWDELPSPPSPVTGASAAAAVASAGEANEAEMEEASSASASAGASSGRMSFHMEQEKSLPGIVMASGGHVFTMLYQLSEVDDPKIQEAIRRLLHLIPTDPAVVDVLDKLTARRSSASATAVAFDVARSASAATLFGAASGASLNRAASAAPPLTPTKLSSGLANSLRSGSFRRGPLQPQQQQPQQQQPGGSVQVKVEDMLRGLLNPNAPTMSPFRVLHNLEVLSGKLMPTVADPASPTTTQLFRREFLSAGGLNLVCGVLRKDFFPVDVSYEIRQGCCLIALQLARFLLCGEVDESTSTASLKLPTTPAKLQLTPTKISPIRLLGAGVTTPLKTSLLSLSPTKLSASPGVGGAAQGVGGGGSAPASYTFSPVKENTEETARAAIQVLQTLSQADFLDMIACLMRVTWAAAAGKLHLASAPVSTGAVREAAATSAWGDSVSMAAAAAEATPTSNGVGSLLQVGRRSRQGSTAGTGAAATPGGDADGALYLGLCASVASLGGRDVLVACESLELLVTCLEVRGAKELAAFYNFGLVKDFIVDVLLGCASPEVREKASVLLFRLSQAHNESSKHSLTQILVKVPVPLWVPSSTARGASQRLLSQCSQYFHLRCRLLSSLTSTEQRQLGLDASSMLRDEVAWLSNFSPYAAAGGGGGRGGGGAGGGAGGDGAATEAADNALLAGHINVVRGLLTCDGVERREAGRLLLADLLNTFLFPASKLIAEGLKRGDPANFNAKCGQAESRLAAYALIVQLVQGCRHNLEAIAKQLVSMHHRFNPDLAKEFEYEPAVEGRSVCNYVGLKNAGATCYMNSVIQQLFLVPGVKEALLAIDDEDADEETLFFQFQMVIGHLQDSKLQYFVPDKFWRCLRLRGQPVNVREQQDSFEFFTHLVDSIDEHLHKMERDKLFHHVLGGVFSDQMICKECPHRYEREQIFLALNLTVKSHNLVDSLEQFVKGELLEGDNAYYCEECDVKRSTVKRMCIKTLPSTLAIQLKRFYYDWDAGRSLKFDDYFQFPWVLDMAPYTAEGIVERERSDNSSESSTDGDVTDGPSSATSTSSSSSSVDPAANSESPSAAPKGRAGLTLNASRLSPCNYELVGVVVHSGQASAGHYYSFIKERKPATASSAGSSSTSAAASNSAGKSRWLKFNDTTVEEFEMNDTTLEAECFGGTYKAKAYDSANGFPETRQRYWNGYILFYDRIDDSLKTPRTPRKSGGGTSVGGGNGAGASGASSGIVTRSRSFRGASGLAAAVVTPSKLATSTSVTIGATPHRDSLSQLSELLNHGERQGLFGGRMPARVQQAVRDENLRFMRSRDVYCPEYYQFIFELCQANLPAGADDVEAVADEECAAPSLNLAVHFLCHTYLRVRAKEAVHVAAWVDLINGYTAAYRNSAQWMVDYWASEDGLRHVRPFLLECPTRSVRHHFGRLLQESLANFFAHGGLTSHPMLTKLIESLLSMLDKDVPDNCKTCPQFFHLLLAYAKMGVEKCQHLFRLGAFHKLLVFLLGADRVGPRPLSPAPSPDGVAKTATTAVSSTSSSSSSSNSSSSNSSSSSSSNSSNSNSSTSSSSATSSNTSSSSGAAAAAAACGGPQKLAIPLPAPSPTSTLQRRWSPAQAKDFGDLHATMATMILNCQLEPSDPQQQKQQHQHQHQHQKRKMQIPLPAEAHVALFGPSAPFYLQELVLASCHTSNVHATSPLVQMLLYVAQGNVDFSRALLREALHQCALVSAGELKNLAQLLQEILLLEDSLQFERLQSVIDGFSDKDGSSVEGMLALIRSQQSSDSRRAYQLMKFLVSLANRLPVAKDYLLQSPAKWQWSVQWLKQKIEQSYWSPHADLSNEDSNTRIFQRTTSAQVTLEEATALLTEFEGSDMETETDADFGLSPDTSTTAAAAAADGPTSTDGQSAGAAAATSDSATKRSKCQFNLDLHISP